MEILIKYLAKSGKKRIYKQIKAKNNFIKTFNKLLTNAIFYCIIVKMISKGGLQ